MDTSIKDELNGLIEKITQAVSVKKIFLFGSYAYGKPTSDSDIDLCVLTEDSGRKIDIMSAIREKISFSAVHPLDIIVYKPDEFYSRSNSKTSMESQILHKGVVLYE